MSVHCGSIRDVSDPHPLHPVLDLASNDPKWKEGPRTIVREDGERMWLLDGVFHREDGPAHITPLGTEHWYQKGLPHREDGPATKMGNGYESWFRWGKCHRTDGPAVKWPNGTREWYIDNRLHRADGPAVTRPDGHREWWLLGQLQHEDFGGETIFQDEERGFTLQVMPDGSLRCGCHEFKDYEDALYHWDPRWYPNETRCRKYRVAICKRFAAQIAASEEADEASTLPKDVSKDGENIDR